MADSLKEKTAKGLFWGFLNNGSMQIIGLVFGIILGRLLSPSDYGMIAMITVFSLVATALQNSGFATGLVNMKEPTDNDYNSVFWFNITVGICLYLVLFICAPFIASYYHTESLVALSRYAFLSLIFSSFGTAHSAYLQKNLMVKQRTKSNVAAVLISSTIGVIMAWKGYAYWSLATQTNIYVLLNASLYWHYSHWRPSLHIDFTPVRKLFPFSVKIMLTTITTNVNNNILNILLGHYFTAHDAGNYNQAYQWDYKCFSLIQGMIESVAQPVLVDLRSNMDRQLEALRKLMRFTAFLAFPLLFGFGLVAKEFIVITIGQKWLISAEYIQILCISGAIMPLYSLLSNFVISKGKSNVNLWVTASLGMAQIIVMLTTWRYGILNMIISYVILNITWLFVWHYFTNRLISYGIVTFLKDILPFAFVAFIVMTITHYATAGISDLRILLAARIVMAPILYYIILRIAGAQVLNESMAFITKKIKKKQIII